MVLANSVWLEWEVTLVDKSNLAITAWPSMCVIPRTAAKKWGHLNSRAFEQASRAAGPAGPSGRGGAMSHWALDLTLMEGASVRGSWRIGGPFQSPTRAGMPLCHGEAVSAYLQAFRT